MSILKTGAASTLDIIAEVKARLPGIEDTLPPGVNAALRRRPVRLRQILGHVRGPRGADRGRADRLHDPGVPRKLALDPDHHGVDPARRALLADRPVAFGPNHQRDDARRPGARRRHSRRRRHRDDREHQPPHGGARRGHRHRDHPRRAGDHAAGDRRALLHLHRLRAAAGAGTASPASCSGRWPRRSSSR